MKSIIILLFLVASTIKTQIVVKTAERCTGISQFKFEQKGLNINDLPNWNLTWSHDPFDKNADAGFIIDTAAGQIQYG